jgi:hypothetical protein
MANPVMQYAKILIVVNLASSVNLASIAKINVVSFTMAAKKFFGAKSTVNNDLK